ncbi:MAG: hypothetical protein ACP5NI_05145 [Acetobacteraceae bacterium]
MPDSDQSHPILGPMAGAVPAGGVASLIRIPIPGTDNLAIELSPRNYGGKSTSTLFLQDPAGKRLLRLDYGWNPKTKAVDFHWNQKGTFADFGIADHTPAGGFGEALYRGARAFKYLGRTLVVVGVALDVVSIVTASNPLLRTSEVAFGWAGAAAGGEAGGALGAEGGTFAEPGLGTAIGGLAGGIVGGIIGYWAGEKVGDFFYWSADTVFTRLPQTALPPQANGS